MKLLKEYRLYTYSSLIFVVVIGFTLNYYLFRYSIHRTTDDVLNEYRLDVEEFAMKNGDLDDLNIMTNKLCKVHDNACNINEINDAIIDTLVYSHYEKEMVVYRKLAFPIKTEQHSYKVELMLPTLEEDDLVGTVIISLVLFVVLFILFTTIIDRMFTAKILHPFTKILESMRGYNIEKKTVIQLENGGIDEFEDLNKILTGMITKINQDYDEMKEFLEHTSHELKTPLAIIQLKLENLNQTNFQEEDTIKNISSIQTALNRIIRFNKSLLFLAKIKNNQFIENKPMNLNFQIEQNINMYEELIKAQNIQVKYHHQKSFIVNIHPLLAEQLIQNILSNAIKHNYEKGKIEIYTTPSYIKVLNTFHGILPLGNLFEKYKHSLGTKDSSGLGLAIVKNICQKNNLMVNYKIDEGIFSIIITNNNPTK